MLLLPEGVPLWEQLLWKSGDGDPSSTLSGRVDPNSPSSLDKQMREEAMKTLSWMLKRNALC